MIQSNYKKILAEQSKERTTVIVRALKAMWTCTGLVLVYGVLIVGSIYTILFLGRILGFH